MPKRKEKDDINDPKHGILEGKNDDSTKRAKAPHEDGNTDQVDATVDYDESADAQYGEAQESTPSTADNSSARDGGEEEQRKRILAALNGWCTSNITADGEDDSDVSERSEALAEVGMLLVFEYEKYIDANAMRSELADIESIIGGDQVVTKFINFLLSLQNQIKKAHAIAAARDAKKNAQNNLSQRPIISMSTVPMHLRPAAQPVLFSKPVTSGQSWPSHSQHHPSFPPYTSNVMIPTARKKESEFEIRKNQILAECTEHLKALIEKASKASDPKEKATFLELIKKVKGRMDSLKSTPSSAVATPGVASRPPQ